MFAGLAERNLSCLFFAFFSPLLSSPTPLSSMHLSIQLLILLFSTLIQTNTLNHHHHHPLPPSLKSTSLPPALPVSSSAKTLITPTSSPAVVEPFTRPWRHHHSLSSWLTFLNINEHRSIAEVHRKATYTPSRPSSKYFLRSTKHHIKSHLERQSPMGVARPWWLEPRLMCVGWCNDGSDEVVVEVAEIGCWSIEMGFIRTPTLRER